MYIYGIFLGLSYVIVASTTRNSCTLIYSLGNVAKVYSMFLASEFNPPRCQLLANHIKKVVLLFLNS